MFSDYLVPEYKEDVNDIMAGRIVKSNTSLIVFGCGSRSRQVTEIFNGQGIPIDAYAEGERYWTEGKEFLGKKVMEVTDLPNYYPKAVIVVSATGADVHDIVETLKGRGDYIFLGDVDRCQLYEMSSEWVFENKDELNNTFEMFADELSKTTFLSYIAARANCIKREETKPLLDLWNSRQYFNDLYPKDMFDEHILIDCGAWIGDTAEDFIKFLDGEKKKVIVRAFEMEEDNFNALSKVAERFDGKIECYHCGVGEKRETVYFEKDSDSSKVVDYKTEHSVEILPVDEVLTGDLNKASLVKMDLEGFERYALAGMKNLIKNNLPMLAVCVYHRIDDLISIPKLISKMEKESDLYDSIRYKYYLRHHSHNAAELVFYAVPYKVK